MLNIEMIKCFYEEGFVDQPAGPGGAGGNS